MSVVRAEQFLADALRALVGGPADDSTLNWLRDMAAVAAIRANGPPATERQIAYIDRLLRPKSIDDAVSCIVAIYGQHRKIGREGLTVGDACRIIDALK